MSTTLNNLIAESSAAGFILADDGNGSGFGELGQLVEFDEASKAEYGSIEMTELATPHISADGVECHFASDWIIQGEGDNPYRVRICLLRQPPATDGPNWGRI